MSMAEWRLPTLSQIIVVKAAARVPNAGPNPRLSPEYSRNMLRKEDILFLTTRSSVITYSKNQHQVEQQRGCRKHEQRIFSYLFCNDIYENNRMDLFSQCSRLWMRNMSQPDDDVLFRVQQARETILHFLA